MQELVIFPSVVYDTPMDGWTGPHMEAVPQGGRSPGAEKGVPKDNRCASATRGQCRHLALEAGKRLVEAHESIYYVQDAWFLYDGTKW